MYQQFQDAFAFANYRHRLQRLPGSELPYISHIARVCFELMLLRDLESYDSEFALIVAALHDTLEDTDATEGQILDLFGASVLSAVKALSKDDSLPKDEQMEDSLNRIVVEPVEVHLVKLADRISNLDRPPVTWSREKIFKYRESSIMIYERLRNAHKGLSSKLLLKIEKYQQFVR